MTSQCLSRTYAHVRPNERMSLHTGKNLKSTSDRGSSQKVHSKYFSPQNLDRVFNPFFIKREVTKCYRVLRGSGEWPIPNTKHLSTGYTSVVITLRLKEATKVPKAQRAARNRPRPNLQLRLQPLAAVPWCSWPVSSQRSHCSSLSISSRR